MQNVVECYENFIILLCYILFMRIKYKYNPEVHKLNVNSKARRFCQKLTDCFLFRMFLVCLILELSCKIFLTKLLCFLVHWNSNL